MKDLFDVEIEPKQKSYYNTNNEAGRELIDSKLKALQQQNRILSFFQSFPGELFTPEEVKDKLFIEEDNTPLTSVRRAITNLTEAGKLTKTNVMKISSYGKKCHTWKAVICG